MDEGVVLDTWAVIALLFGEPAGRQVHRLLEHAAEGELVAHMSAVNWGESMYVASQRSGQPLQLAAELIRGLPVVVSQVESRTAESAALLKAERGLGYADAFAVSLALSLDMPLVTGDPDFRALEPELALLWIGDES